MSETDPVVEWTRPMGIPFIDGNRLWSIIDHTIKSSEDFGVTWTDWLTIDPIESPIPTLFRDRQGNKYYAAYRELDNATEHIRGCLMRVDHETKVISRVVEFLINGPPAYQPDPMQKMAYVNPWNITEGLDHYLYVGQYGNVSYDAGLDDPPVGIEKDRRLPCAYIWIIGPDANGRTGLGEVRRCDKFISEPSYSTESPTFVHVHNIKCNPYDGGIYVTVGDSASAKASMFVSFDRCDSFTAVGGGGGYTGLTFTPEAVYMADDLFHGQNHVRKSVALSDASVILTPPTASDQPSSGLRATSNGELWRANHVEFKNLPDGPGSTGVQYLFNESGNWHWVAVTERQWDSNFPVSQNYFIAEEGRAVLPPACPYLLVSLIAPDGEWLVQRIRLRKTAQASLANWSLRPQIFDWAYYVGKHPDIRMAGIIDEDRAGSHWTQYGLVEGRQAHLMFSLEDYVELNPDVKAAYQNNREGAIAHYFNFGIDEGRVTVVGLHPDVFEWNYYVQNNPDIRGWGIESEEAAKYDWLTFGIDEGRQASATFAVQEYLQLNPDVPQYYDLALRHFVLYGRGEGRQGTF